MTQDSSVVEIQTARKFAVIGNCDVAILATAQDLYTALYYRKSHLCNVYAHEDLTFLCFLARQSYPSLFFRNHNAPHSPLQLPTANEHYALQDTPVLTLPPSSELQLPISVQIAPPAVEIIPCYWGISGLNGFCTCNNLADLCSIMHDPLFLTGPWARCFYSEQEAYIWAKNSYVERFYRHYDSTLETITLPHEIDSKASPAFFDRMFQSREDRLAQNSSRQHFTTLSELAF